MCHKTFHNDLTLCCHVNRVHDIYGFAEMVQIYGLYL